MISEKPWSLEAVGRLMMGVIGMFCTGMLLNTLLGSLKLGLSEEHRRLIMVVVSLLVEVGALFWVWFFLWEQNLTWHQAFGFLSPRRGRVVILGAALAVLALPATWILQTASVCVMEWVHLTPKAQVAVETLSDPNLSVIEKVLMGVIAIVAAPVVEECLFRGVLYPGFKRLGHPRLALWGTSILFGAIHMNVATFLPLACFGAALVLLYEETDNLLAPIVAHSVFNSINFLVLIFMDPVSKALNLK